MGFNYGTNVAPLADLRKQARFSNQAFSALSDSTPQLAPGVYTNITLISIISRVRAAVRHSFERRAALTSKLSNFIRFRRWQIYDSRSLRERLAEEVAANGVGRTCEAIGIYPATLRGYLDGSMSVQSKAIAKVCRYFKARFTMI